MTAPTPAALSPAAPPGAGLGRTAPPRPGGQQAQADTQHPGVLGQHDAVLRGAHTAGFPHSGRPQVQTRQAAGEAGERQPGDPRRNEGGEERSPDRDLGPRQEPCEAFGLQLAQEGVRPAGHAVQPLRGRLVRLQLAQSGIQNERAGNKRRGGRLAVRAPASSKSPEVRWSAPSASVASGLLPCHATGAEEGT